MIIRNISSNFLNTLRKLIDEYLITKIVVFWDGENNTDMLGSEFQ